MELGAFELAIGGLMALLALFILADSFQVALRTDRVMWGADSPVVLDGAQYLGLIWDASRDLIVHNPFDAQPDTGPGVLHPGWVATGLLHALGLPASLALLAFKPVAFVAVFLGAHLYTRRLFGNRFQRRVALVLALLLLSPVAAGILLGALSGGGIGWLGSDTRQLLSMSRELYPLAQLWGYPWASIAIGLMPLSLLAYERARRPDARRGWLVAAAGGAALVAWLHPWQGLTLLTTVIAAEIVRRHRPPLRVLARRLVPFVVLGAAPIGYLAVLTHVDEQSRRLSVLLDGGFWRPEVIAAALLPVLLPALLAYRVPARDFQERAVRWWPALALFVYAQPAGTFRNHAIEGLALPLAVLTVTGCAAVDWGSIATALSRARTRRALALGGVTLMCLPGLAAHLWIDHRSVTSTTVPPLLEHGEDRALRELRTDPRPGSVLAPVPIAVLVPGLAHREVWSSGLAWSPHWRLRAVAVRDLFAGRLAPDKARALVRRSGAAFLLADCRSGGADLRPVLGPLVRETREFGCARIYELAPSVAASASAGRSGSGGASASGPPYSGQLPSSAWASATR
jgi:hypothetical protein